MSYPRARLLCEIFLRDQLHLQLQNDRWWFSLQFCNLYFVTNTCMTGCLWMLLSKSCVSSQAGVGAGAGEAACASGHVWHTAGRVSVRAGSAHTADGAQEPRVLRNANQDQCQYSFTLLRNVPVYYTSVSNCYQSVDCMVWFCRSCCIIFRKRKSRTTVWDPSWPHTERVCPSEWERHANICQTHFIISNTNIKHRGNVWRRDLLI